MARQSDTQFDFEREQRARDLAGHVLEIQGKAPHRIWYLRKHAGAGWTECVAVVEAPERFFVHGDWNQIDGMSRMGSHARDTFFDEQLHPDYVWGKYEPLLRDARGDTNREERLASAKAMFYAARARFLELYDPVKEKPRQQKK